VLAKSMRVFRGKKSGVTSCLIQKKIPGIFLIKIRKIRLPAGGKKRIFRGKFGVRRRGRANFSSGQSFALAGKKKRAKKLTHFSPQTC
jgi:hypothetical protein